MAVVLFNITPADAEFDRDILLTLGLNQTQLPANTLNVTMAYYDDVNGVWQTLDYEAGGPNGVAELTLSAPTNHFSIYGVLAELTPTQPAHFVASGLTVVPGVEKISAFVTKTGETVTITANVVNDGGEEGTYAVVLKLNGDTVDTHACKGQLLLPESSVSWAGASVKCRKGSYFVEFRFWCIIKSVSILVTCKIFAVAVRVSPRAVLFSAVIGWVRSSLFLPAP